MLNSLYKKFKYNIALNMLNVHKILKIRLHNTAALQIIKNVTNFKS